MITTDSNSFNQEASPVEEDLEVAASVAMTNSSNKHSMSIVPMIYSSNFSVARTHLPLSSTMMTISSVVVSEEDLEAAPSAEIRSAKWVVSKEVKRNKRHNREKIPSEEWVWAAASA